jgi:hypothetical protein
MLTQNLEYNNENVVEKLTKKLFANSNEELIECVKNSKLVIDSLNTFFNSLINLFHFQRLKIAYQITV